MATRHFSLLRASDFLALDLEAVNLRLEAGTPPHLVPDGAPALLILRFPPQHLAEEAFPSANVAARARSLLADPTRLVFRVAAAIPLTLERLLDWGRPEMAMSVPGPKSIIDGQTTAIEFPYRLLLAPGKQATWRHQATPLLVPDGHGGIWAELWQTALDAPSGDRRVWAIGTRSVRAADPFAIPVPASDRALIAAASRGQTAELGGTPDIRVERFVLSSLGASVELHGAWATGTIAGWSQQSGTGRDQRVRIDTRGYLYPTGHQATVTTISERTMLDDGTAPLLQHVFLTVTEAEQRYDEIDLPFRRITIAPGVLPELDLPIAEGGWPVVNGQRLQFGLTGIDSAGNHADFTLPLGFVPLHRAGEAATLLGSYAQETGFGGQRVAIAPANAGDRATTMATRSIAFVDHPASDDAGGPPFRPLLDTAMVEIPAINQLFGGQQPVRIKLPEVLKQHGLDGAGNPSRLFAEFVDQAIPVRPSAQQLGGFIAPSLNFAGLSRELGPVSGAANLPPAQALASIANGNFDPVSFLGDQTKLLGVITIAELFPPVSFTSSEQPDPGSDQLDTKPLLAHLNSQGLTNFDPLIESAAPFKYIKAPALTTRQLSDEHGLPAGIDSVLLWKPKLSRPAGAAGKIVLIDPDIAQFWLVVKQTTRAGQEPDFLAAGQISNFKLSLLDALVVSFARVRFQAERGKAISFKPDISDVQFTGPLAFVNQIQKALKAIGIDLPFELEIHPTYIKASYALPLPALTIGVFSLENIRLSSELTLPFVPEAGPVRLRFALGERSAPFLATISLFAGGGFFALEIATDGSMVVEAAIEFGGRFSINLVVASGSVYLLGGFYFSIRNGAVTLEAYVRCGGAVEILGIITISIEFYIGLRYISERNELTGIAHVRACIEVLFFSECVSFDVEKTFTVPSSISDRERIPPPPDRFADLPAFAFADRPDFAARDEAEWALVSPGDWANYCAAFA